jgi:hypothetical protein
VTSSKTINYWTMRQRPSLKEPVSRPTPIVPLSLTTTTNPPLHLPSLPSSMTHRLMMTSRDRKGINSPRSIGVCISMRSRLWLVPKNSLLNPSTTIGLQHVRSQSVANGKRSPSAYASACSARSEGCVDVWVQDRRVP